MIRRISRRQVGILFLNERNTDLYLLLPKTSLRDAARSTGMSYSHAFKLYKLWEGMKLLESSKVGVVHNFFYTGSGYRLSKDLQQLKKTLKRYKIREVDFDDSADRE